MPDDGMQHEVVRGELRTMPPPGYEHEVVAGEILFAVKSFVKLHELGQVSGAAGFLLERSPDVVRAPDFAFIAAKRLPPGRPSSRYLDFPPDLVAEVISPNDSASDVQEKIEEWLQFGVRAVWAFYPTTQSVWVHRSKTDNVRLGPDDMLDGGDILPEFHCRVGDLFLG